MRVWIIDDQMSEVEAQTFVPEPAELTVSTHHDDDFSDRLSEDWDLILVDENFGEEPGATPTVFDGSSFVGWLRAEARRSGRQLPSVAIFTTQPDLFANEVPAVGPARPLGGTFVGREAYLAPILDTEWLFAKYGAPKAVIVYQIAALGRAQEIARVALGKDGASFDEFVTFLGLPADARWRPAALSSLERARLPISEAAGGVDSFRGPVSAVRWLLHDTLPFPGAFLSDTHVATRLGVIARLSPALPSPRGWLRTPPVVIRLPIKFRDVGRARASKAACSWHAAITFVQFNYDQTANGGMQLVEEPDLYSCPMLSLITASQLSGRADLGLVSRRNALP